MLSWALISENCAAHVRSGPAIAVFRRNRYRPSYSSHAKPAPCHIHYFHLEIKGTEVQYLPSTDWPYFLSFGFILFPVWFSLMLKTSPWKMTTHSWESAAPFVMRQRSIFVLLQLCGYTKEKIWVASYQFLICSRLEKHAFLHFQTSYWMSAICKSHDRKVGSQKYHPSRCCAQDYTKFFFLKTLPDSTFRINWLPQCYFIKIILHISNESITSLYLLIERVLSLKRLSSFIF